MERKKYLLVILFVLFNHILFGQNSKSIYTAYATGNMTKWKSVIDSLDAVKQKTDKELLDLINYQYGYIAWCIGKKYSIEAEKQMNKAIFNIKYLEEKKYDLSMIYAYRAAFVGFEIGLAPYKAPFIGHRCTNFAQKSVQIDPNNTLAYIQLGFIAYYTPAIFGGSKNKALEHFFKALEMMEAKRDYKTNNWNYLNLHVTLIKTCLELNKIEEAKKYCLKALDIEPDFDWVKNNLYPQVIKRMQQ